MPGSPTASAQDALRQRAREAARGGRREEAWALWAELHQRAPHDPEAANALGNRAMAMGRAGEARALFETAVSADPGQPALQFNLAAACRALGDMPAALAALDRALIADPYFVQALFQRAVLVEETGDARAAATLFRDFLDTVPPAIAEDPRFAAALAHARGAVAADGQSLADALAGLGDPPSRRLAHAGAMLTHGAPSFRSEPTFLAVPELPAIPFFERAQVPWLERLEAAFPQVLAELRMALAERAQPFVPYVANPPGTALNQWAALDHNRDWGALFFWRHGQRDMTTCRTLPLLAQLVDSLPLLRIAGRGPNAFLSRVAPRTRIPPHHGVTNARITVHLPLIVPPGCFLRVGSETRTLEAGKAWAFDDTIEHEAWNDSDEERIILIIDAWNPLLSPEECAHLTALLAVYDRHYGRGERVNAEF